MLQSEKYLIKLMSNSKVNLLQKGAYGLPYITCAKLYMHYPSVRKRKFDARVSHAVSKQSGRVGQDMLVLRDTEINGPFLALFVQQSYKIPYIMIDAYVVGIKSLIIEKSLRST